MLAIQKNIGGPVPREILKKDDSNPLKFDNSRDACLALPRYAMHSDFVIQNRCLFIRKDALQ